MSKENLEKLKKGDSDIYQLINRPEKKFEKSIMISGGISYYGLSKLIILEGTLNEFTYWQALMHSKEDVEQLNEKNKINLKFENNGTKAHTSKSNIKLIEQLFGKDNLIQNPPNSPDLSLQKEI